MRGTKEAGGQAEARRIPPRPALNTRTRSYLPTQRTQWGSLFPFSLDIVRVTEGTKVRPVSCGYDVKRASSAGMRGTDSGQGCLHPGGCRALSPRQDLLPISPSTSLDGRHFGGINLDKWGRPRHHAPQNARPSECQTARVLPSAGQTTHSGGPSLQVPCAPPTSLPPPQAGPQLATGGDGRDTPY